MKFELQIILTGCTAASDIHPSKRFNDVQGNAHSSYAGDFDYAGEYCVVHFFLEPILLCQARRGFRPMNRTLIDF